MSKKLVGWVIGIVVVAGVLFFLGKGLTDVSVQDFEITGVEDVSIQSFTLSGNLFIENPSLLSVPIEKGEYVVVLRNSGETISTGTLPRFTLDPNQVNEVDFSHEVNWRPTVSLASQLLTQESVYVDIEGNVTVSVLGITTYKAPFSEEIDIKGYLSQFGEDTGGTVDSSGGAAEDDIVNDLI